jgi:osmotically inducible protein OsmC
MSNCPLPKSWVARVARLAISLPGMDPAVAKDLVDTVHQVCPYSSATRGNIVVELTLV